MKTTIVLLLLTVFFAGVATAQVKRNADPSQGVATTTDKKAEKREMMQSLNLSKQQMEELKEFRRAQKQKKDEIVNDQSLTDQQRQEKLQALRMEQKQKLDLILTPDQKEKLKQERMNNKMQKQTMDKTDSTGTMQ